MAPGFPLTGIWISTTYNYGCPPIRSVSVTSVPASSLSKSLKLRSDMSLTLMSFLGRESPSPECFQSSPLSRVPGHSTTSHGPRTPPSSQSSSPRRITPVLYSGTHSSWVVVPESDVDTRPPRRPLTVTVAVRSRSTPTDPPVCHLPPKQPSTISVFICRKVLTFLRNGAYRVSVIVRLLSPVKDKGRHPLSIVLTPWSLYSDLGRPTVPVSGSVNVTVFLCPIWDSVPGVPFLWVLF